MCEENNRQAKKKKKGSLHKMTVGTAVDDQHFSL